MDEETTNAPEDTTTATMDVVQESTVDKTPSDPRDEETKMDDTPESFAKDNDQDKMAECDSVKDGQETARKDAEVGDDEAVRPKVTSTEEGGAQASCIFKDGWSTLSRDEIIDKVKGVIYGQAIGDALGLATEFMTQKMAKGIYGKKGPSGYSAIYQDFHRSRWDVGDWTDDTDQLLLILQMIVDLNGTVDKVDFARRIHNWMIHGFQELGDIGGMGIGMTVKRTLTHGLFIKDPHEAAKDVWEKSGRYLAANGAIMRTAILGVLNFNDVDRVVKNTVEICHVTHADPRCVASCIATTTAIALILQGKFNPSKKNQLSALVDASISEANKVLEHKDQCSEMEEHIKASSLDKLKLDDKQTIGYTFKALGAGFYGLRHAKDFRETLLKVIMQAGDADSNGSVCGALMGCKLGFKALPQDLLAFKHRGWLDNEVDKFLETIGLKQPQGGALPSTD